MNPAETSKMPKIKSPKLLVAAADIPIEHTKQLSVASQMAKCFSDEVLRNDFELFVFRFSQNPFKERKTGEDLTDRTFKSRKKYL